MSKTRAYSSTEVPVARSQEELRALLRRFGVDQFTFGEGSQWVGAEFIHDNHLVRLRCPLRSVEEAIANDTRHVSTAEKHDNAGEREAMRVWRVLVWTTKARLVAVEEGIESFEQAFFAQLVDPSDGRTVWENVQDEVQAGALRLGGQGLRALPAST